MGKRRIPNQDKKKGHRLPTKVTEVKHPGPTNNLSPVFSFSSTCKQLYQLSSLQKDELDVLINSLQIMSKLSWKEVLKHSGLRYKGPIEHYNGKLPEWLDDDVELFEFRFSRRGRVFGYRTGQIFNIIWFDRNHEVNPMS